MFTRNQAFRYALLPGFIPRLSAIFGSGFVHVSFLMAVVYGAVRLLPQDHPYLNPQNKGRFGIRHVIAEAANNLVLEWKNIDQIIIFFMLMGGLVILMTQLVLFIFALIAHQPALAGPFFSAVDLFDVNSQYGHGAVPAPGHRQDLAFIILDRVFGLIGIYDSCIATATNCVDLRNNIIPVNGAYPSPSHLTLHTMLQFYSRGIFLVGVFIILYFVIAIVGETAATGSPFGQRINKAWVPLRALAFFALLVPLNIGNDNAGLNGAQIITFWTAKIGSNFATNAWGLFDSSITESYLGPTGQLVAQPNVPSISHLINFMYIVKTCENLIETEYLDQSVRAWVVRPLQTVPPPIIAGPNAVAFINTPFNQAYQFSNYGTVTIRFGTLRNQNNPNHNDFARQTGEVFPHCGEITLTPPGRDSPTMTIQALYYNLIQLLWQDANIASTADCFAKKYNSVNQVPPANCPAQLNRVGIENLINNYQSNLDAAVPGLLAAEANNVGWNVTGVVRSKGWAGASIWYNAIARLNGEISSVVQTLPQMSKFPHVMETVLDQRLMQNENLRPDDVFQVEMQNNQSIDFTYKDDANIAAILARVYAFFNDDDQMRSHFESNSNNAFINAANWLFGTRGIFDMRNNTNVNPLAQLSALGKGMMDASIRNLTVGIASAGVSKILPAGAGKQETETLGTFFRTVGTTTLAMSFVLYYVLPFMPFIYFMFAVSGWVKGIFEAIVAMPLWALAHLRVDGEGLPGTDASTGYFLLLEIFLRPILITFGMLASITIFSAMVQVLNDIFDLVVVNVGGFNVEAEISGAQAFIDFFRGPVDQFFLTAIYAIICYMIGLSSFKLIDLIPDKILRWAGVTAPTFQESSRNAAEEALQKTYSVGLLATGQLRGGALAALTLD